MNEPAYRLDALGEDCLDAQVEDKKEAVRVFAREARDTDFVEVATPLFLDWMNATSLSKRKKIEAEFGEKVLQMLESEYDNL